MILSDHRRVPNKRTQRSLFSPDECPEYACPGCGAKPGEWVLSPRFRKLLAGLRLCIECAEIREVVEEHLRGDLPPDPNYCPHPRGSDEKIAWMARRARQGYALFQVWDDTSLPAPFKLDVGGFPGYQGLPGETGIEKCGKSWRVRPFWRGRKWPLGIFAEKQQAIEKVRKFWSVHSLDDRPPPVVWLPTADEDLAIAIEIDHLSEIERLCGLKRKEMRFMARSLRDELVERERLPSEIVFNVWVRRLAQAAGPTFSECFPSEADFSMGYTLGS